MASEPAASAGHVNSEELLTYIIHECHEFFGHLSAALAQAKQKGTLPPLTSKKGKVADSKKEKVKRKPNAFNNFIKQKILELRAAGEETNSNSIFANAVAAWKELSDDQRKQYTDKYIKDGADEVSLDDLDLPNLPSALLENAHKVSLHTDKMDEDEHNEEELVDNPGEVSMDEDQAEEETDSEENEGSGPPQKTPTPASQPTARPAMKAPASTTAPSKSQNTAKESDDGKKDKKKRKQKEEKEAGTTTAPTDKAGEASIKKKKKKSKVAKTEQ